LGDGDRLVQKKITAFVVSILAFFLVFISTSDFAPKQQIVLSVLVVAIVLWISEAIPLFVTAFISSFLLITLGGFGATEIFQPYFDPVIVLFLGGFLLALAVQKVGLDHFFAFRVISKFGTRPHYFMLGMMLVTAFLSMWMSNTAAAAIMIPICIAVLGNNGLLDSDFSKASVLSVAYAATIGGIGSVVGSPPNAIAVKYIRESGVEFSFLDWMLYSLPFVILALIFIWLVLLFFHKTKIEKIEYAKAEKQLNSKQLAVLGVFALTLLGWLTTKFTGLSSSTVALLPIILVFVLGILNESDLLKISWPTLLLFGGGLSLGEAVISSGLNRWMANLVDIHISGLSQFAFILVLTYLSILISMIASNTAAAAVLVPLLLPISDTLKVPVQAIAIFIAIGVSLDFMMPIGTPPSAIAYSTGLVSVKDMMKNGFVINLGTGLILSILMYFLFI